MMRFLLRLIIAFIVNALALVAADKLIAGFTLTLTPEHVAVAAAFLTVINTFVRPIAKLFLTPIIILTLGLGAILLNAAILWALDFFLEGLIIEGILPLLTATVLIGIVNLLLGGATRHALTKP